MADVADGEADLGVIAHRVPDWPPVPDADGVVAVVRRRGHAEWADLVLAAGHRSWVVWAATGATTAGHARHLVSRLGVRAAARAEAGAATPWVAVTLETAIRLRAQRARTLGLDAPWLTITTPTPPDASTIPIPHLVTVRRHDAVADLVVWELLPPDLVPACLGAAAGTVREWAARAPALLRLRTVARERFRPETPWMGELRRLLAGRPLTLPLVLQHPDRFAALLDDAAALGGAHTAIRVGTRARTTMVARPAASPGRPSHHRPPTGAALAAGLSPPPSPRPAGQVVTAVNGRAERQAPGALRPDAPPQRRPGMDRS